MKTLVAVFALLLVAFPALARDDVNVSETMELPKYSVKVLYSGPTEMRTDFVKRIAPELAAFTEATGYEACGVIALRENGADGAHPTFSLHMGSLHSHIACDTVAPVEGYVSMGTTVHSHPQQRRIRLSAIDMKARGTPAGKLRTETVNNCEFSDQDYAHEGFLVTCGKLLYQNGRGTVREH